MNTKVNNFLTRFFCKHEHVFFDDKETLICSNCSATWPISPALTKASGVFLRIEKRIEQEAEYNKIIKLAESYQNDINYVRK